VTSRRPPFGINGLLTCTLFSSLHIGHSTRVSAPRVPFFPYVVRLGLVTGAEQDTHLDALAQSIGRQHHISTQINNELETHTVSLHSASLHHLLRVAVCHHESPCQVDLIHVTLPPRLLEFKFHPHRTERTIRSMLTYFDRACYILLIQIWMKRMTTSHELDAASLSSLVASKAMVSHINPISLAHS
jgi:hypothetical protein